LELLGAHVGAEMEAKVRCLLPLPIYADVVAVAHCQSASENVLALGVMHLHSLSPSVH